MFILAPASNKTPHTCAIAELVVKLVSTGWETSSVHIRMVEVDISVNIEDSKVIAETSIAHLGVLQDPGHCVLLMRLNFRGIKTRGIVFSNSDFKQVSLLQILEFMCSGDNLSSGHVIVVGGVIWDDGAGAEEVIVG